MIEPGTAIVTGGTYGIGRAIALELARRGWRLVVCGLEARQPGSAAEKGIEPTRQALAEVRGEAEVIEADVSQEADVRRVAAQARERFGTVTALVNNAAIRPTGTILETDLATWNRALAVNLTGAFLMAREVIPHMKAAGGGAIVNIGSGAGWGKPGLAAYGTSKGGLYALTMALAYDHLVDGIRVNLVIPGPGTASGMVEAIAARDPGASALSAKWLSSPEGVAQAVAFLLSNEAAGISGTVLDVGCFSHQGGAGLPPMENRPRPGR